MGMDPTPKPERPRWLDPSRRWYLAVALTAALGTTGSVAFYTVTAGQDRQRLELEFGQQATRFSEAFRREIRAAGDQLNGIQSLYHVWPVVGRRQFRGFVSRQLAEHPEIVAFEWLPRVREAERAAYEEGARRDGFPGFEITERGDAGRLVRAVRRPEYFPVYYVEPYRGNEAALGFDSASRPASGMMFARARDTGLAAATEAFRLVQEKGSEPGLLICVPVYHGGVTPSSVEDRRRLLRGFALSVFRPANLVEGVLRRRDMPDVAIELSDASAPVAERLLYRRAPVAAARGDRAFMWQTGFDVGGRRWEFRLTPTPAYLAAHRGSTPWLGLVGGLLLTAVLLVYLATEARRVLARERDEKRLAQAEHEAAALRAIATVAAAAAHEINNPLTILGGHLALLKGEVPSNPRLAKILGAAERVRDIVDRMARITRVEMFQHASSALPPMVDIKKSSGEGPADPARRE
jgi:CHASE1-domain containing sensor protein